MSYDINPYLDEILILSLYLFAFRIVGGSPNGSTRHVGHWMAYCTCPGWLWWRRIWWNEDWQGKLKYSEKTCPSVTLPTTNPTWPDPGTNPGRRSGKPATNRLSYGAASALYPFPSISVFWSCEPVWDLNVISSLHSHIILFIETYIHFQVLIAVILSSYSDKPNNVLLLLCIIIF
jgi:hypothetical protein